MNWCIRRSGVQPEFLIDKSQGYFAEKEDCVLLFPSRGVCVFMGAAMLILTSGVVWLVSGWIAKGHYLDAAGGIILGAAALLWVGKETRESLCGYLWIYDDGLPERIRIGDNITPKVIQRVIVTETYRVGIHSIRSLEVGLQVVGRRDFVSLKQTARSEQPEQIELARRLAKRWGVEYKNLNAVLENKQFDKQLPLAASCFWDNASSQDSGEGRPRGSS